MRNDSQRLLVGDVQSDGAGRPGVQERVDPVCGGFGRLAVDVRDQDLFRVTEASHVIGRSGSLSSTAEHCVGVFHDCLTISENRSVESVILKSKG